MKLNYSKKIFIISIITLAGILVFDIIFTNLLLGKITDINNKIKQLNISSQERERELNLKDAIQGSKLGREELEKYFVPAGNAETVVFTKFLEGLAAAAGVTQSKTLDYSPVVGLENSGLISALHFRFTVSGSWVNVFNFLRAIENLPKVSIVNSVSFYHDSGGKNWSADLDLSVIKLKI